MKWFALLLALPVCLLSNRDLQAQTGGVTVQFSSSTYSANEGSGSVSITVTLSSPSTLPVTVNYATSDGTAKAPGDYLPAMGTLTFPPNNVSQSFSITIVNDSTPEPNETVNLTLTNATNATLGLSTATLTIIDDDLLTVSIHRPNGHFVGAGKDQTPLELRAHPNPAPTASDVDSYAWSVAAGPGYGNFQTASDRKPNFIGLTEGECIVQVDLRRGPSVPPLTATDQKKVRVIKIDALNEFVYDGPYAVRKTTDGMFTIPFSTSQGKLLAVLIQPPVTSDTLESRYIWDTHYGAKVDQETGDVEITLIASGSYLVRVIREGFGAAQSATTFGLTFNAFASNLAEQNSAGTNTELAPGVTPGEDELILLDSTKKDEHLNEHRKYFKAKGINYVEIDDVKQAIEQIKKKFKDENKLKFTVTVIGHGAVAIQVMGSGRGLEDGKYIGNDEVGTPHLVKFTDACNGRVSGLKLYGCSVSAGDVGKKFVQNDVANKAGCRVQSFNGEYKIIPNPVGPDGRVIPGTWGFTATKEEGGFSVQITEPKQ